MKKIGLIGCGYWGKNYIKTINQIEDLKIVWVCNPHTAIKKVDLPNDCSFTKDYNQILKDPEVDAVIIATPPATHYKIIKDSLNSNKDVLAEKPLTLRSKEVSELFLLATKKSKILMVGHTFIYHPAILKLKEKIDQGIIGKIKYFYSDRSGPGPVRSDINVIWNLVPHDISIINFLIKEKPVEVFASGSCLIKKNIEDVAEVIITYENNIKSFLHLSWLSPKKTRLFTAVGSKYSAFFDDLNINKLNIINTQEQQIKNIDLDTIPALENQCLYFLNYITTRKQPETDAQDAFMNTFLIENIQKSLITKKVVKIKKNVI